ncbi:MAG: glycine cleavage system aminomethyltransferase GcvT [Thermoplasmatota archaeon]
MARTALYDRHAALGATFTEFAGYDMPVVYGSINEEHQAVRTDAGLFDVSHMSNLWIEGPGAVATINAVTTRPIDELPVGKGQYGVILHEDGTILDDVFTFRLEEERFLMVPNAGRNEVVASHLGNHAAPETALIDETSKWSILAFQGPEARDRLAKLSEDPLPKFHRVATMTIAGAACLVTGTGYTGEKGVEIFVRNEDAPTVWDALVTHGKPIGLGARDTLRLEKGYALAGNEFEGGRTPLEAGLGWLIDWDHEFLGKAALLAQKETTHDVLMGLVQAKGVPRHGYPVCKDGEAIGVVTSGTKSPTTGQGIALAYVRGAAVGDEVTVEVRSRHQEATLVKPPFA